MSMSSWITPASRIDAGTLLLGDALLRAAGLLAVLLALAASRIPMPALVFAVAAAWSMADYLRLERRIRGRALHCTGGAWCWLGHAGPDGDGSRESLALSDFTAAFGSVLTLRLEGAGERYRLVVWLPLLKRECRRRILLSLRYAGDRTVSTGSQARSG